MTVAPWASSSRAVIEPIPPDAPVRRIVLPSRSMSVSWVRLNGNGAGKGCGLPETITQGRGTLMLDQRSAQSRGGCVTLRDPEAYKRDTPPRAEPEAMIDLQ